MRLVKAAKAKAKPKSAARKPVAAKAKAVPKAKAAKPAAKPAHKAVPKADGDAAVQAYLNLLPGWQADVGRKVDTLITKAVPGVKKAIKWHSAMYGVAGQGWFAAVGGFKEYVKVNFFDGTSLNPVPPSGGTAAKMRAIDIREGQLDPAQMTAWAKQAAQLPGWGKA